MLTLQFASSPSHDGGWDVRILSYGSVPSFPGHVKEKFLSLDVGGEKKKGKNCPSCTFAVVFRTLCRTASCYCCHHRITLCVQVFYPDPMLFSLTLFVFYIPLADAASMLHPTHLCCYVWSFSGFTYRNIISYQKIENVENVLKKHFLCL